MSSFKLIIQKIIKTENNVFSSNYDKTDNVNILYKVLFQKLLNDNINVNINTKKKFIFFSFVFDCFSSFFFYFTLFSNKNKYMHMLFFVRVFLRR